MSFMREHLERLLEEKKGHHVRMLKRVEEHYQKADEYAKTVMQYEAEINDIKRTLKSIKEGA